MPFDRAATLRNAEGLLRQGKIEPAIAEYLRILEEQPNDWTTANTLGDLYVRVGQAEKAVDQFVEVADGLKADGFRPKAAAVYKKLLKLNPDHEHALLQSADLAAGQGLYADARAYLSTVIAKRQARGDRRGVAEARIRLASLDPNDYDARLSAAAARRSRPPRSWPRSRATVSCSSSTDAIRATASIATKVMRRPIISTPSRASATHMSIDARSAIQPCLIPFHSFRAIRSRRDAAQR